MSLLQWLQDSAFGQFIESSSWANLALLCCHALGMSVLVGVVWMLDLRVLGFPNRLPLSTFRPLLRLAWVGFLVNAASGLLMFSGASTRFIVNADFQLKMLLIVLGGLSVLALRRALGQAWPTAGSPQALAPGQVRFSATARLIAVASILCWLGVILLGRQIAYTLARPAA
jgi:hypothetical protein